MATFYDKLVTLCSDVGITISHYVEKELGLQRSTATSWRRGSRPNRATLLKITAFFNVPERYLMDDSVPVEQGKGSTSEACSEADDFILRIDRDKINGITFHTGNDALLSLYISLSNRNCKDSEVMGKLRAVANNLKDRDAQISALQQKVIDCQNELINAYKERRPKKGDSSISNNNTISKTGVVV